jgi:hypothetical protein
MEKEYEIRVHENIKVKESSLPVSRKNRRRSSLPSLLWLLPWMCFQKVLLTRKTNKLQLPGLDLTGIGGPVRIERTEDYLSKSLVCTGPRDDRLAEEITIFSITRRGVDVAERSETLVISSSDASVSYVAAQIT